MATSGDMSRNSLEYLLGCGGECERLDYKEDLSLGHSKSLCDFVRDVLALKNVGGGFIVVGVRDKTWEPVGLDCRLPYDTKQLRDKVRKGSGLDLEVDIVHHTLYASKIFALIHIRASKRRSKRRTPSLVKIDFDAKESYGLRRGEIYGRRGDSTVRVSSTEELEQLLDDLEDAADEHALDTHAAPSPFAISEGLYRLLDRGFDTFIGRETLLREIGAAITGDPRIWIVNVHGPGGVGKSAAVNAVTYKLFRQGTFESIIQLSAKEKTLSASGIITQTPTLVSLENLLDHILTVFEEPASDDLDYKRALATELMSAYRTLLVLDNMETVGDGRIIKFVQGLPVDSRARVLLTSRERTGNWEFPISVAELSEVEVRKFLAIKASEMGLQLMIDDDLTSRVSSVSGGLPLAIQWLLGQYKVRGDMEAVLHSLSNRDSPILEFSFGNIWSRLSGDAKATLAVASIFDSSPSVNDFAIATAFNEERIERSLAELKDYTLMTEESQASGRSVYLALPITISFARHQLDAMDGFEVACRRRHQEYKNQMTLQEAEINKFAGAFATYGLTADGDKRAAILCRRAESEMFLGKVDSAEALFMEARSLAPTSAYILALSASYELARNRIGKALEFAEEATKRATRETGVLCYTIKARIYDVQRDRRMRSQALSRALEYDPSDSVIRHQLGVTLSRLGETQKAVDEFTTIINAERLRPVPRDTYLMALSTRIINLRRLRRNAEAAEDLALANELIARFPHLRNQAEHFRHIE
jgi:tetratricopeptide (TPR) repeat protein